MDLVLILILIAVTEHVRLGTFKIVFLMYKNDSNRMLRNMKKHKYQSNKDV